MKASEIEVGKVYAARVSERMVPVRIVQESPHGGWHGLNLSTMREVRIRGAQRLRYEVVKDEASGKYRRKGIE